MADGGVFFKEGVIGWLEQLLLLGITSENAESYPPGSRNPVNLRKVYEGATQKGFHMSRLKHDEHHL